MMEKLSIIRCVIFITLNYLSVTTALMSPSNLDGMNKLVTCQNFTLDCPSISNGTIIQVNSVNTTSRLEYAITRLCNSIKSCNIMNSEKECVEVMYSCIPDSPTLEIKRSSTVELMSASNLFYMVSDGYKSGLDQEAQKVDCSLTFGKQGTNEQMQFIFQEFAPFYNATDYCLQVHGSSKDPYCTGQKTPIPYYGIFQSTTGWEFTLQVRRNGTFLPPNVRYWIAIAGIVGQPDENMYHLTCTSSADKLQGINLSIIIVSVGLLNLFVRNFF